MKKIYLIQQNNTNLYKIGITKKDINERIKELQTGNANQLVTIHEFATKFGYKLERAIHCYFNSKKFSSEWFELSNEDINNFLNICSNLENNLKVLKQYDNPFL